MKKRVLSTTKIIMLGFLIGALVGAVLLYLPISLQTNEKLSFIDAIFVSTSSICVTGLSTVNIGHTFSPFGQLVILCLIQMGGLGVVTFTTLILILLNRRITLADRLLIQSAYNLDTLSGLVALTTKIVKITLIIEGIGALGYSIVFIRDYGPIGIWYSIFHSVSAFCNAGIDLLGQNSFCMYTGNVLVNITTMVLIIAGGLGFPVYWEIAGVFKKKEHKKKRMSYHAKLVIILTIILIVSGALFTFFFEYNNPDTLGGLSLGDKILASFFQSVSLRTAGFATIDQSQFRPASVFLYLFYMFIGGSPAGTAGGVKTVTVCVLFASIISNIRGKHTVSVFKRAISDTTIRRCVSIVLFSFSVLAVMSTILMIMYPDDILSVLYEVTSAIGTVGLSRGLTSELNFGGKILIAIAMYLGRIGPITFALAFNSNKNDSGISYPDGKVIIG